MDMTKLLGSQIGLDDFIFVHRKGNLNTDHVILTRILWLYLYII